MSDIHPNVLRVMEAARERGLEITTKRFPEGTKTAADAAAAIGVSVGQIVKSLVFGVDSEIVMALVSGSNQLDEKKLAALQAAQSARVLMPTRYAMQLVIRLVACRLWVWQPKCECS